MTPRNMDTNHPRPTLAEFLKHFQKYGLDNANTGYRSRAESYGNYKKLRMDALVLTARHYLGVENYADLVGTIGYSKWRDEAIADWNDSRAEWAVARAFYDRTWGGSE